VILPASRFVLRAVGAALGASIILLAIGAWRLTQGPMSISFLSPYLTEALGHAIPGYGIEIDDTVIGWTERRRTLDVHAVNVRLRDDKGRLVLTVPEVSIGVSVTGLLEGALQPTRIEIIGAEVRLVRDESGRIDLGSAPAGEGQSADAAGVLTALMHGLMAPDAPDSPLRRLTRVGVLGADISLEDRLNGTVWRAPRSDLFLKRDAAGVSGELAANLDLLGEITRFNADLAYDPVKQRLVLKTTFDNFRPARLAVQLPALAPFGAAELPFSGDISIVIDANHRLAGVGFDVTGGAGKLVLPGIYKQPLVVRHFAARGRLNDRWDQIVAERIFLELDGPSIEASGTITRGKEWVAAFDGRIRQLPVDRIGAYWPHAAWATSREWIAHNLTAGTIDNGRLRLRLSEGAFRRDEWPADSLAVDFDFASLTAHFFRPLPPLTDVRGVGHVNPTRLTLDIAGGRVGDVAVREAKVAINDLDKPVEHAAVISFTAATPVVSALTLLDREPLGFIRRLGVPAGGVEGDSVVRANLVVPLLKDLNLDQVVFDVNAAMTGVGIPKLFDRFALSRGNLKLKLDATGFDLGGEAALNAIPARVNWRQEFAPKTVMARYTVAATLDDSQRAALGLPVADYVRGPTAAEMTVDSDGKGALRMSGEFKLDASTLTIDAMDWRKPAGVPGRATYAIRWSGRGPVQVERATLRAGDLKAQGSMVFDGGALQQAEFREVEYAGNAFDMVAARRRPDGGYSLRIDGKTADLRAPMRRALAAEGGGGAAFNAVARIDRAVVADHLELRGLNIEIESAGGKLNQLHAVGAFEEGGRMEVNVEPGVPRRRTIIRSDNAAGALRYLGIVSVRGGSLKFDGDFADDQPGSPLSGLAVIDNFKVVGAPVLAQILSLGSLTGIANVLGGEGIAFTRADVPITLSRETLTLDKSRAIGPALGITADGTMNRHSEELSLTGTLAPAYTINSVLGYIPLLGTLLVGREGEGLVAFNYGVSGTPADPKVTVNPLSALLPGVLRRLFPAPSPQPGNGNVQPPTPSGGG
jgi:Protein of unknown function/AsmA-like C-terminal region